MERLQRTRRIDRNFWDWSNVKQIREARVNNHYFNRDGDSFNSTIFTKVYLVSLLPYGSRRIFERRCFNAGYLDSNAVRKELSIFCKEREQAHQY